MKELKAASKRLRWEWISIAALLQPAKTPAVTRLRRLEPHYSLLASGGKDALRMRDEQTKGSLVKVALQMREGQGIMRRVEG
jgi:hypothetical protein